MKIKIDMLPHNLCTGRTSCESPLGTCYRFLLERAVCLDLNRWLNPLDFQTTLHATFCTC